MSLGTRLKELRLRNRQSLQGVADAVGASKAHIWELEMNRSTNPSLELLKKLADHFKVSVAALVGETIDPADEELMVMNRLLRDLEPGDREVVKQTAEALKRRKRAGSEDEP